MREIIDKIRRIDTELARRKRENKLDYYNRGDVVHEKQLAFHRSQKRNRWVFGGNRTGKTECGAAECAYLARGCHPYRPNRPGASGWVVSLSAQVQRDVAQKKVLGYLRREWIVNVVMASGRRDEPEGGVIDYIEVENVFGGVSRIGFRNCEQGREKFQGASLDFVWFDEEPPEDVYEECRMRVADRRGDVFATMTPLKGLTWVYDRIYLNSAKDPETEVFTMEWADNPYLNREEIALLTGTFSRESLESRRYGKFSAAEGLVYPEFDPAVHVIDPFPVPREWYDTISIDPGLNNPLSAHWYAVDFDGNVYVVAEHYEAGRDVAYHAARLKEISASLGWHTDGRGRLTALIDSAAEQRTLASVKSVSELFYDHGVLVNTRVNKDLFSGINRVKGYLKDGAGKPRLFVFRCCTNLIREFKGYWWGGGDVPRKKDDHALDELRYYVMSRPEASRPPAKTIGPLAAEKRRLAQRAARERYGY